MNASAGRAGEYDHLFKLLLVGDTGVGKSSILLRFTDDTFEESKASTIGVDFKLKMMTVPSGKRLKLTIWDTAGQERFRTLTSSYYRGAQGIILVYDSTRRDTFEHLEHWLKEIDMFTTNKNVVKMVVGNKVDLEHREVTRDEGIAFARSHSMLFVECSAKTRMGVQQTFDELVNQILEVPSLTARGGQDTFRVNQQEQDQIDDWGACPC